MEKIGDFFSLVIAICYYLPIMVTQVCDRLKCSKSCYRAPNGKATTEACSLCKNDGNMKCFPGAPGYGQGGCHPSCQKNTCVQISLDAQGIHPCTGCAADGVNKCSPGGPGLPRDNPVLARSHLEDRLNDIKPPLNESTMVSNYGMACEDDCAKRCFDIGSPDETTRKCNGCKIGGPMLCYPGADGYAGVQAKVNQTDESWINDSEHLQLVEEMPSHARKVLNLAAPQGKSWPPPPELLKLLSAMNEKSRTVHVRAIEEAISMVKDQAVLDQIIRVLERMREHVSTNAQDFAVFTHDGTDYKVPVKELNQFKVHMDQLRSAAMREAFQVDITKWWHYVVAVLAVIVLFMMGACAGYYYKGK